MDRRAWKYHTAQAKEAGSDAEAARTTVQRLRHKDTRPAPPRAATAEGGS